MGLNITYGAFDGAYSAFSRWREFLIEAISGTHKSTIEYWDWKFPQGKNSGDYLGMYELFQHSDCDGELAVNVCVELVNTLERCMPQFEQYENEIGFGSGQILSQGGYVAVTKQFINGCKKAIENNESLVFQ